MLIQEAVSVPSSGCACSFVRSFSSERECMKVSKKRIMKRAVRQRRPHQ